MPNHDLGKIGLTLMSVVTYMTMLVMNEGAASGTFKDIFSTITGNVSRLLDTDFTPAPWTFQIWNLIYLWQCTWLGYVLSRLFRRNQRGWVYMQPDILPNGFYFLWMLNNVLSIEWLFLWDRMHLISSLFVMVFRTISIYIVLIISHRALHPHTNWLKMHSYGDLLLIRILVQNGIAIYATWTTIATLLNFTIVLAYIGNVCNTTATEISLCILFFMLMGWFYLETVILDKYVRYNLTIYPGVLLALAGILKKKPISYSPNSVSVLVVLLLAVTVGLGVTRLLVLTGRKRTVNAPAPPVVRTIS